MLIPQQIITQLGVPCIFEIMNQLRRTKPRIKHMTPARIIMPAVLSGLNEHCFRKRLTNSPAKTVEGTLPLMITPKTGLRKSSISSNPNCERIFRPIKNSHIKKVTTSFDPAKRLIVAATKYPQPINPRIPHQPRSSYCTFPGSPVLKMATSKTSPSIPATFRIMKSFLYFSFEG